MSHRVRTRAVRLGYVALAVLLGALALAAQARTQAQRLQDAVQLLETKGDYLGAIAILREVTSGPDRGRAARAWLLLGDAYEKLGRNGARQAYEQLLKYDDQPTLVAEARARLARLTAAGRTETSAGPAVRRVWDDRYVVLGPLSRDGQSIPAVEWFARTVGLLNPATGRFQIILREPSMFDEGIPSGAAVSPDGSQLAFGWLSFPAENTSVGEIRVTGVDGSGRRTVLREKAAAFDVVEWTPDGRNFVAKRSFDNDTSDLLMVAAGTNAATLLAHLPAVPLGVSLSPDGRRVAYDVPARAGDPNRDIGVLDVDTRRQRLIVRHLANDTYPVWHPDGRRLVFVSDRTGVAGVWQVPAADSPAPGEPSLVRADLGRVEARTVSAAGSLYFGLWAGVVDVYVSSLNRATGQWSAPATVARRIVGNNYFSAWSPDSRWLALASRRGGHRVFDRGTHVLVLHDMATHEEREITPEVPTAISWPSWSPDARSLMVRSKGGQGLYRVDATSGAVTPLVERQPGAGFASPTWMPDGRGIVFIADGKVWLRNLDSAAERVLYESPTDAFALNAAPSPDGRLLAIAEGGTLPQRSLRVVPMDGGPARTVMTVPSPEVLWVAGWTPDGLTLVVTRSELSGDTQVGSMWSVAVADGTSRPLGIRMDGLRDARLSPDGQRVAFTAGNPAHETWVLENAIPPVPAPRR